MSTSTFNRATQGGISKGYHSRVLFTYCAYDTPDNRVDSDWTDVSNFDGIGDLISAKPEYCHGNHIIPALYWAPGKTLRVRGTVWAYGIGKYQILNMRFGIINKDNSNYEFLAIQNNNHNHNFLGSGIGSFGLNAVEFETHIQCVDTGDGFFSAQGYYQYNYGLPVIPSIGGDVLDDVVYVPVWNGTQNPIATGYTSNQTAILFNFYGSALTDLYISRLIIEELA